MPGLLTPSMWRAYGGDEFPATGWRIEGDVLHALPGSDRVQLISRDRFSDFDVSLEWRLPVGGNSGLLYRVLEDGAEPWASGPEMQLLHDAGHPDGQRPETSSGALYDIYAPEERVVCPPGLFNIARVRVSGSHVEHWLNGKRVLAYDLESPEFRARVARSKFRGSPHFARAPEGHLVLQHHGTEAWFYDIRVEVPAPSGGKPVASIRNGG
jgi:hypothetical protein